MPPLRHLSAIIAATKPSWDPVQANTYLRVVFPFLTLRLHIFPSSSLRPRFRLSFLFKLQKMVKKTSVLIVGAGEFGAGTALSLLKTGNYTVTMIDRAPELPALDAASTDINKVVRWDYSDKDYAKLAREAIDVWNRDYKGIYFQ